MDMAGMLQQALQSRGGAQGMQPTTTETVAPVQGEVLGGDPGMGMPQEFTAEDIAEQLAGVEAMMETVEDPQQLAQLQEVADQLRAAWEDLVAATPQGVQGSPGPREGHDQLMPPMDPGML